MDYDFNFVAGVASILGFLSSGLAFWQATRASKAAREARDAVVSRTLADELEVACIRAEQLADYLRNGRLAESQLRIGDLTSALSEIRSRRSPYLAQEHSNSVLTIAEQIRTIGEAIDRTGGGTLEAKQKVRNIAIAREAGMRLRGVLGAVKSSVEQGDRNVQEDARTRSNPADNPAGREDGRGQT